MSKGRKIAEGMTDFAAGLFSAASNKAESRLAKRSAAGILAQGVTKSKREALKMGHELTNELMQKESYKMGAAVGNAKVFKGITDSFKARESGATAFDAIRKGHMVNGHISAKKVAGTAFTVGVAGRVVTGGGLYRDRYGNFNLPGVPFI